MVIQIDGAESINKGAQLMLVAVLQQIKERYPGATVVEYSKSPNEKLLRQYFGDHYRLARSRWMQKLITNFHLEKYANFIELKYWYRFTVFRARKGVDVMLNIGGFQFGDQWKHNRDNIRLWRRYLKKLKSYGTKVVFLPQAFGPFEKPGSREILKVLNTYADLLIARDAQSYQYLVDGGIDNSKMALYPDFTNPVKGVETPQSSQQKGKVCIIPNNKMLKTGVMQEEAYVEAMSKVIKHISEKGFETFLLNHAGSGDLKLCNKMAEAQGIPVIKGLDAVQTKGVIASSYMVISSRFHGVANALSSSVPCLASSWSHKYQRLLEEFGQGDCLVDLTEMEGTLAKVDRMLDSDFNANTRNTLTEKTQLLIAKNQEMWDYVWNFN